MNKKLTSLLIFVLITSCTSEDATPLPAPVTETSTTSSTTSSTTTTIKEQEVFAVDEFGIELIEMKPQMKEQFDALITFVEKKTGLTYTEYPKYQLIQAMATRNIMSYLT